MRTVSNRLNKKEVVNTTFTLESKPISDLDTIKADANTIKVTPTIARIGRNALETSYIKEPTTFNLVNVMTQLIMSPDHTLDGDKSEVDYMSEVIDSIGFNGGTNTWEQVLTLIFKHQIMFGNAYIGLITKSGGGDDADIVDFDIIDPKLIDYAKDGNGNIVLDEVGRVIGYIQTIPEGSSTTDLEPYQKAKIPETVAIEANQLFIPREKIVHFKLHALGDNFYPLGFIEPAFNAINYKLKLEESLANAIWRDGFPTLIGKYGDANHVPTKNQIQDLLNNMQNLTNRHTLAVPYYVNIKYLESKSVVQLREHLVYFTEQIVTSFGIPQAIATATGEACYSEDTRTLTENGFKYYWEIKDDEKIATFNPENEQLEYHLPTYTEIHNYKGKMHHYKNSVTNILVTPEHKMYYRTIRSDNWIKNKSKDITHKCIKLKNSVDYDSKEVNDFILPEIKYPPQYAKKNVGDYKIDMDTWLEFLGYFISEGYVRIDKYYVIELSQVDKSNLKKMETCLKKLPFKYTIKNGHGRHEGFRIFNKSLAIYLYEHCGIDSHTRQIPKQFLKLSKRQLRILFDALIVGDGSDFGTTGKTYATVSDTLKENVLELFIKLGYATSTDTQYKNNKNHIYRVSGNKTHLEPRIVKKNITEVDYDGVVYCYEVPNHLFITERGGKIAIQGNTNRATLTSAISVVETILENIINNTVSQIEYKLFMAIARSLGKKKIPTLEWDKINTTEVKDEFAPDIEEPPVDTPTEFK